MFLGIDIGTTGVRAIALDPTGEAVFETRAALPPAERSGSRVTQDADLWRAALRACLGQLGPDIVARVRSLAIDGTSGTVLGIDRTGTPVGPALMYDDASGGAFAARIDAAGPPQTAAKGAANGLARAMTVAAAASPVRIVHQADWIAGLLTGRFDRTDESNALKTGYDPVARRWPDWLRDAGFDSTLLPEVLPAGAVMGLAGAPQARALGLDPQTLVVAGCTDGCAAFLASGAHRAGDAVTSLGSSLTIKILSGTPVFAAEYGIYSHRIGDVWLPGGASNSGGAAVAKHFSPEEMTALEPALRPDEPTGLDYYPLIGEGERFPIRDAALRDQTGPRPR